MVANNVSKPTECCPKISEFIKRNWPHDLRPQHNPFIFCMKECDFRHLSKRNLKKLKLTFWAKKSTNIVLEYTKICGIATFGGGGMFSEKKS